MLESHGLLSTYRVNSFFSPCRGTPTKPLTGNNSHRIGSQEMSLCPLSGKHEKKGNLKQFVWEDISFHRWCVDYLSSSRLLSTLNKDEQKIPLGWPRISYPPILYSSHSFLWRGAPLTQQPKEDALFDSLPPPPHLSLFELTKRPPWWGDCRLSFAEPTAVLTVKQ